jgi:hypothetical protein
MLKANRVMDTKNDLEQQTRLNTRTSDLRINEDPTHPTLISFQFLTKNRHD